MNNAPRSAKTFYSPGTLAAYNVLHLPTGLFLYGLNLSRRKRRIMGSTMLVLSACLYVLVCGAILIGVGIAKMGVVGLVVAYGVYQIEAPHYRRAISEGANRARWWPPLLFILGTLVLIGILAVFVPEEVTL